MKARVVEIAVLAVLLALLASIALSSVAPPPSVHSSFDTGRNGYRALYDVLQREGIPVTRLELPLGMMSSRIGVLVVTTRFRGNDLRRLAAFKKRGGFVLELYGDRYTNLALSKDPTRARDVYDDVAGKGLVAFDERPYGYDRTQSLWSVLPVPVHVAAGVVVLAVLLALIDANVRFAPPIVREPPAGRDSSDYLRSMAALLRRAHAGRPALERFAHAFPESRELGELAAKTRPDDAAVMRAATLYAALRKERH